MRRRRRDLWWLLGAGLAAAALTPLVVEFSGLVGPEAGPILAAPTPAPAPSTTSAAAPAAPAQTQPLTVRPTGDLPPVQLRPPYEIGDGLTILTENRRIRIAGIEGPGREAACFDASGNLWGCGLQARAALNNLIRQREVVCRPTGERVGEAPLAHCTVGGTRIDRALVALGFAKPAREDPVLARDQAEAQAAGRGLWNGGWRIR